jgi:hypothetical protein
MNIVAQVTAYVLRITRALLRSTLPARYDFEVGGYVHDTAMSQFIAPNAVMVSAGTWSQVETGVADIWGYRRAAADATANVWLPIPIPSNGVASKGAYLKSVDVYFTIATEALDALAATVYKVTLPADGAAASAAAAQAFTYDSGHDAAGERVDIDEHTMTLTLDSPFWLDDGEYAFVELALDGGTNGVFTLLGARANYTLRL